MTIWVNSVAPGGIVPVGSADIWINLDGRLNAPNGAAQYPNLVSSYAPGTGRVRTGQSIAVSLAAGNCQPPWMIAAVDYAVGVPQNITLRTDFYTQTLAGGSLDGLYGVNNTNGQIFPLVDNLVLDGWDLTTVPGGPPGIIVNVGGVNNFTVQNCNFGAGTVFQAHNNLIVQYCDFNGNASTAVISHQANTGFTANTTLKYNRIRNFYQHVIESGANSAQPMGTLIYEYNLIEDGGADPGGNSHLNYLNLAETYSGGMTVNFNTFFQHKPPSGGNGVQFFGQGGDNINCSNSSMQYNTCIAVPSGGDKAITFFLQLTSTPAFWVNSIVASNYADLTGAFASDGNQGNGSRNFVQPTNSLAPNPAIAMASYLYGGGITQPAGSTIPA